MLRRSAFLFILGALASCGRSVNTYRLAQNPNILLTTELRRSSHGISYTQKFDGLQNAVGMDRNGQLRRHILTSGLLTYSSYLEGAELVLPSGRVPAPTPLTHLSAVQVMPLVLDAVRNLELAESYTLAASTAPAGDIVMIEWNCTKRTRTERHYTARYEVTVADLRYANIQGRWTLVSAEYSEREFVQRWNLERKR